ncbi:MAG: hypothetical protein ABJJ05_11325 [Maribacter litoralis]|uniref:hypothetical protein n=1 Tax=Maribacter litoralis TaxID=2059726 RepID=UPI0032973EE8
MKKHHYNTSLKWIGNVEKGTHGYRLYNRNHEVCVEENEHVILGSYDPSFLGDTRLCTPEELFFDPISNCHKLWYLQLCCAHKFNVIA